jgi:hypothetical protein
METGWDIPLSQLDIPTLTRQALRWKFKKSLKSLNNRDIQISEKANLTGSLHDSVSFPMVLGTKQFRALC